VTLAVVDGAATLDVQEMQVALNAQAAVGYSLAALYTVQHPGPLKIKLRGACNAAGGSLTFQNQCSVIGFAMRP
jgi:hypothetical protein